MQSEEVQIEAGMIEYYTGKKAQEVLNDYTLPELIKLSALIIFMQNVP